MKYISKSESDTINIAAKLTGKLKSGDVLCLRGDLGAGKTVFARALIRHLSGAIDLDVPSPTFTLVQNYETADSAIYHFDLYRIENTEDIYELGWEDALSSGITIIEWPQRLEYLAPNDRLELVFNISENNETEREITIIPYGAWEERINEND